MTEEKGLSIARIELSETDDGKAVVEMWEDNPRLKWPSLRLFELSKLFDVGIDPNELAPGNERFVRFTAYYVESDRLNAQGNPYKDVVRLEAVATDHGDDALQDTLDRIVELLVNIEHHLEEMANPLYAVDASGSVQPMPQQPAQARREPEKRQPPEPTPDPEPVLNEDQARRRFAKLAGPAVRNGAIPFTVPGELTGQIAAKAINWRTALQKLEAAIAKGESG